MVQCAEILTKPCPSRDRLTVDLFKHVDEGRENGVALLERAFALVVAAQPIRDRMHTAHVRDIDVTVLSDGCATFGQEAHETAIAALRPVARIATVAEVMAGLGVAAHLGGGARFGWGADGVDAGFVAVAEVVQQRVGVGQVAQVAVAVEGGIEPGRGPPPLSPPPRLR